MGTEWEEVGVGVRELTGSLGIGWEFRGTSRDFLRLWRLHLRLALKSLVSYFPVARICSDFCTHLKSSFRQIHEELRLPLGEEESAWEVRVNRDPGKPTGICL